MTLATDDYSAERGFASELVDLRDAGCPFEFVRFDLHPLYSTRPLHRDAITATSTMKRAAATTQPRLLVEVLVG